MRATYHMPVTSKMTADSEGTVLRILTLSTVGWQHVLRQSPALY
jgi:hypothetical protein